MTTSKIYETWTERLDTGTLTKSEISQAARVISRQAAYMLPHGRVTNLTRAEAQVLYDRIRNNPVRLTNEHTKQGITWFERHAAKALGMSPEMVAGIVEHFDYFTRDGSIYTFGINDNGTVPVWTVHLTDGRELRYRYAPWVSGVNESSYTWTKELV